MPVTCKPAPHEASVWSSWNPSAQSAEDVLNGASPADWDRVKIPVGSSFSHLGPNSTVFASSNGFVSGVMRAYNNHHHLAIRPEDVWFSVLTQLSLYINANADQLRHKFVAHQGQKDLTIYTKGSLETIDYAEFLFQMGKLLEENVTDPELRKWLMPAFTTTTKVDQATASAIFMGTMQKYFNYICSTMCGIPSVTLLGERSDWETILNRLDRLPSFGPEPTQWFELLQPVIRGFLATFDAPSSDSTKNFWQTVAHRFSGGSGPTYLSGWITAFCFWDGEGKMLYETGQKLRDVQQLKLDGVPYHQIDYDDIPPAFTTMPLKIDDSGVVYNAWIMAGSIGMALKSSGKQIPQQKSNNPNQPANPYHYKDGSGLDTLQPESGWIIYLTKSYQEVQAEEAKKPFRR